MSTLLPDVCNDKVRKVSMIESNIQSRTRGSLSPPILKTIMSRKDRNY